VSVLSVRCFVLVSTQHAGGCHCRSGYYQPQQLRPLARSMSTVAIKALVQAFNHFVSPVLLQLTVLRHRWRSDEPAAVCPECGCTFGVGRRALDVTTTSPQCYRAALASGSTSGGFQDGYHGLPVAVRHDSSLSDRRLVSDNTRRQLRSATSRTCVVRRTYSNHGDRCFVAAGPKRWNSLPAELRQADVNFQRFKWLLKKFLFGC